MDHLDEHIKSFARNGWFINAMPVIAAVKLLCGIIVVFEGDRGLAALWLLMATLWFLNYHWSSQTPFIVLSEGGLTLRPSPLTPGKEIPWHTIMNAQLSGPSRLTLYLANGRKFSIYLVWIDSKDRKPLLQMVAKAVAEKGAQAERGA